MRAVGVWIQVFCFFGCVAAGPAFGQDPDAGVDWSRPETIDPFDEGIGDFLDVDLDALGKKAFEAYQAKDYEAAAQYYLAFLRHDIGDSASIYNLACCYGLLGKAELAAKYLDRAVKKLAQQSLVRTIHVFVALCDNKHQGIVPVPAALGNGQDPHSNLYWGAMYGLKTYFSKSDDWELISTVKAPKAAVLERCVFKHKTADVYLVADAYDGREIKQTVVDFLTAAAGGNKDTVSVEHNSGKRVLGTGGGARLVAYVGHNGLMDFALETYPKAKDKVRRDAIVLGCKSKPYFSKPLNDAGANALLLTTGLMAPEAYTLKSAIDGWIAGESAQEIRLRAAKAYDKYQDCGLGAAKRLFAVRP